MTGDPQHLISVSLGKMAMARSQRGGVNLHKNLLVASVLQRARSRYVIEGCFSSFTSVSSDLSEDSDDECEEDDTPVVAPYGTFTSLDLVSQESDQSVPDIQQWSKTVIADIDKENTPPCNPSDDFESNQEEIHERLGITSHHTNIDKIDTCHPEQKNYLELSPVKTALKRRLSRQTCQEPAKRCRSVCLSDSYCDTSDAYRDYLIPEPMQAEPTISSLVTIFNTGFNGLCNAVQNDITDLDLSLPIQSTFDIMAMSMAPPIVLSV